MTRKHTTEWIDLELDSFDLTRKVKIRGKEVEVMVSPYDIPKAVRSTLDVDTQELIFEFKYLNEEPTENQKENDFAVYVLGKFSRRLYAIKFDIKKFPDKEKFLMTMRDAIFGKLNLLIKKTHQEESVKDNYELVKDAVKANQKELFAAV